jgi:hypothetical protein
VLDDGASTGVPRFPVADLASRGFGAEGEARLMAPFVEKVHASGGGAVWEAPGPFQG